jgi:hypothetical protein
MTEGVPIIMQELITLNKKETFTRFCIYALLGALIVSARFAIAMVLILPPGLSMAFGHASPTTLGGIILFLLFILYKFFPIIYLVSLLYGLYSYSQSAYTQALRVIKVPLSVFVLSVIIYILAWCI